MMSEYFNAYVINKNYKGIVKELPVGILPQYEVTIRVAFSSLNYKDALSSRGLNGVTKSYPHIPGIDAVGKVIEDHSGTYKPNEWVIVTGNDLGTNTFGGFGEIIRVPNEWVVAKPTMLSPIETMIMGTAGFTAMYGILRLKMIGIQPKSGPILVTGASGGVGSFAVFALACMGYHVVAATKKATAYEFLLQLGAKEVISSNTLYLDASKPLHSRKWTGSIETVGGDLLSAILSQIEPKGAVACCGNILGIELNTNILPFILRGISLLGIDSAFCLRDLRKKIWNMAGHLNLSKLPSKYTKIISIQKIDQEIEKILRGDQKGRIVISHN